MLSFIDRDNNCIKGGVKSHIWTQEMIQFLSPIFRINKPFLQAPARNNPRYEACFDLIRGDFAVREKAIV